jgi:hypothetical protein
MSMQSPNSGAQSPVSLLLLPVLLVSLLSELPVLSDPLLPELPLLSLLSGPPPLLPELPPPLLPPPLLVLPKMLLSEKHATSKSNNTHPLLPRSLLTVLLPSTTPAQSNQPTP